MSSTVIDPRRVVQFVTDLLNPVMHYKRALSIGQAVVGTMHAGRLSSAAVGRAQARVFDITPKSGIKQVDRLLGNEQFDVEAVFQQSVPWLVAHRAEIVVSLDWTEYGAHGHSRIAVNLVTTHGRATPLVWKTVETKRLKRRRNRVEDEVLRLLASVLPQGVTVILLADRGFGDVKLYAYPRGAGVGLRHPLSRGNPRGKRRWAGTHSGRVGPCTGAGQGTDGRPRDRAALSGTRGVRQATRHEGGVVLGDHAPRRHAPRGGALRETLHVRRTLPRRERPPLRPGLP